MLSSGSINAKNSPAPTAEGARGRGNGIAGVSGEEKTSNPAEIAIALRTLSRGSQQKTKAFRTWRV